MDRIPSSDRTVAGLPGRPESRLAALILAALALRFLFAASLGLGMDEAYTVATSRTLALSGFDHPPMAWWLVHAAGGFLGQSDLALRSPFILLSALTNILIFLLGRRLFGAEAGFWASFALCMAPVLGLVDACSILPDAPLLPALLGGAWALSHVFFDEAELRAPLWWLLAGLFAGLALLAKYHGVFLLAGAGLFMLLSPRQRRWFFTPWPYLAAALALAMFAPALIWNAQHGWVSFLFQGARTGEPRFRPGAPFALLGMQALFLLPWVFVPALALFIRAFRRGVADERGLLLACLAAGPIVLFTLPALWSEHRLLPHWAAPGYLLLLPLLGREIAEKFPLAQWMRRAVAGAAGFVVFATVSIAILPHERVKAFSGPAYPFKETLDWTDFRREFYARGLAGDKNFVVASRWFEAGKLDAALGGAFPVLCLSDDPRGFGVTRDPEAFVGRDAILVGRYMTLEQANILYEDFFDSIEPLPPISIAANGAEVFALNVYRAKNFHDPAPEFVLGLSGARRP